MSGGGRAMVLQSGDRNARSAAAITGSLGSEADSKISRLGGVYLLKGIDFLTRMVPGAEDTREGVLKRKKYNIYIEKLAEQFLK